MEQTGIRGMMNAGVTQESGFTLAELLIAMAMSLIIMAGVYRVFDGQQKSFVANDQVAAMQQNLRAAMFYIERELRMAGCDPTGMSTPPGILTAETDKIRFTEDVVGSTPGSDPDGDVGDTNEDITYYLMDKNGDGLTDLVKDTPSQTEQLLAENIEALNFVYLDEDNVRLDDSGGDVTSSIGDIRAVQVTIVARADAGEKGYSNSTAYQNFQSEAVLTAADTVRRRMLRTHVECRNLGI